MARKFIGLLLVIGCMACVHPQIVQTPPSGDSFQAIVIKFNFSDGSGKQSGKIHWRFDNARSKILFFTPLNQVGLELDAEGETVLLLRPEKKLFWWGEFSDLIDRLWDIELTLDELKRLVVDGSLPENRIRDQGIEVRMETGAGDPAPKLVRIRRHRAELTLKILKKEIRPGSVVFLEYRTRFRAAELDEVLGDD